MLVMEDNNKFTIGPEGEKSNEMSSSITEDGVDFRFILFDKINSDIALLYLIKLNLFNKQAKNSEKTFLPREIKDLILSGD